MTSKEIRVPDLGDFKEVAVIDVLVQPGETIQVDTPLVTLETEKATMDVPSPEAGIIEKLHVSKGSSVSGGSLIATLSAAADAGATVATGPAAPGPAAAAAPAPMAPAAGAIRPLAAEAAPAAQAPPAPQASPAAQAPPGPQAPPAVQAPPAAPASEPGAGPSAAPTLAPKASPPAREIAAAAPPAAIGGTSAHASPSVRKFARELGVDLSRVRGTGQKGRITAEDLKAFVKSAMARADGASTGGLPKVSVPDFSQFGPIELKPLTRVQRISGPRVHASWVNLPHVTQFDEADITELEATRKRLQGGAESAGVKLTPLAFIVMACVKALQKYPQFNASLDQSGQNLILKKYIHIGFAADTRQGLLVPVIHDANRKDIYETARALAELAEKARGGKLSVAEMQGGSFTISSLGGIGGTAFTPIINAPEVAILGVSRASMRPVYQEGGFVPRLILPLSLSYDHRVIDGAAAARFSGYVASMLADPRALLEAVP